MIDLNISLFIIFGVYPAIIAVVIFITHFKIFFPDKENEVEYENKKR